MGLANSSRQTNLPSVSWLRRTAALVLLALWVPATSHCRIENLPGLEFLSCCQHAGAEQSPAHHDNDCATDGCAAVESGLYYKADQPHAAPEAPLPALIVSLLSLADLGQTTAWIPRPAPSTSPPVLSRTWQFALRAALPVRAPSHSS